MCDHIMCQTEIEVNGCMLLITPSCFSKVEVFGMCVVSTTECEKKNCEVVWMLFSLCLKIEELLMCLTSV